MQSITSLGTDAQGNIVLPTDWRFFITDVLIEAWLDQPSVARKLAGARVYPLIFDGKENAEFPVIDEMEEPEYAMQPDESDTNIKGSTITVPTPQLFKSVAIPHDKLALLFAGRDRMPLIMNYLMRKFRVAEDKKAFQGDSGLGVAGLADLTGPTYDLGNPTGVWGADGDANGVLENAKADWEKALDYFVNSGVPSDIQIDVVMTSYIWNLLRNTYLVRSPQVNNLEYLSRSLNGGTVYYTNHLQATVTATTNRIIFVARTPAAFTLLSSNFDQDMNPHVKNWLARLGVREKFSVKVFEPGAGNDSFYVAGMDGISNATS